MPDLAVRGGWAVTPRGMVPADIAIEDGRISAIARELPGCGREIDARGLAVFPALIDIHVHFNEPGRADWEGAATGSRALAAGGGAMFFDMPLNSSPCTLDGASFDAKRAALERASITDFALWGGLTPRNLDTLDELAARGVIGFKAFMAQSGLAEFERADDLSLYEGMRVAARWNLPVAVHAESDELTGALTRRLRAAGRRDAAAFLESRPVLAELEAIQRAILFARETGAKLHIVHVSTGRGVALAVEARSQGVDVTVETCPHYLFFADEDLSRIGAAAKCAPPLRPRADRDELWSRVMSGEVDMIASDHSPCPRDLKMRDDFFDVWGGIAGVQTTLAVLLGGCAPEHVARLTAEAPAARFGLANKGRLEVGCEANLALVDLLAEFVVAPEALFDRHKLSPYTGARLSGRTRRTLLRGDTIFHDGRFVSQPAGRFVRPDFK